jgi:hypothetical protein
MNSLKLEKSAKKMIRNDVYTHEVNQLELAISNNSKWKHMKNGIECGRKLIIKLKDKNGQTHQDGEKILEIASDFYEKLYSSCLSTSEKSSF